MGSMPGPTRHIFIGSFGLVYFRSLIGRILYIIWVRLGCFFRLILFFLWFLVWFLVWLLARCLMNFLSFDIGFVFKNVFNSIGDQHIKIFNFTGIRNYIHSVCMFVFLFFLFFIPKYTSYFFLIVLRNLW